MSCLFKNTCTVKGLTLSQLSLRTLLFIHFLTCISAEMFHLNRDPSYGLNTNKANKNKISTFDHCKKYLCKYGYLRFRCDCKDESKRTRRSTIEDILLPLELDMFSLVEESSSSNSSRSTNGKTPTQADASGTQSGFLACTTQHYTEAIKSFQKVYHLDVTGICDQTTMSQMSQRRCGQSDTFIDKDDQDLSTSTEKPRKTRSLHDIISSGINPHEKSIERRKEQLNEYMESLKKEPPIPHYHGKDLGSSRSKRSVLNVSMSDDYGIILGKSRVSWRLMTEHYSQFLTPQSQRAILKQAFRYWSEVTPLCFYEDMSSPSVDIDIGFLEGVHLSCQRQFDGFGGEIAHKFYRDVHFDKSEPYTVELTSNTAISLLLVAVHELGHVIGLNHSDVADSVMNAIYHQSIHGQFELSDHDRRQVRLAYGPCSGRFDTAFDYVRTRAGSEPTRIYNTYFFRSDHYWMYENNNKRARFGDPLPVKPQWPGVPTDVDAFVHYFDVRLTATGPTITDEYFFFKGDMVLKYCSVQDRVIESTRIQSKFLTNNLTRVSVPINLDSAFFDIRDKNIYFFKDEFVYIYQYKPDTPHSCCVGKERIIDVFPPAAASDRVSPTGNSYASNIDSVYLSYFYSTMYFIKGDDVWQNTLYRLNGPSKLNSIKYLGKWYDIWHYICDGECS